MKKLLLLSSFLLCLSLAKAQDLNIETTIEDGVKLHDKGDYTGAIALYDQVLNKDPKNVTAKAEKGLSLLSLKKYTESIAICQEAIDENKGSENTREIYSTLSQAWEYSGNVEKALEIYDQGILVFPTYHRLYYNKGVTLTGLKKYKEAQFYFMTSLSLSPNHVGSHNGLGRMMAIQDKKIPTILALCRVLILEPKGSRAVDTYNVLGKFTNTEGSVEKTGKNKITIHVDASSLGDTTADGKNNKNNFGMVEILLSMHEALMSDKKMKGLSPMEKEIKKFETMFKSMQETQDKNDGFFWKFYVPYYSALVENGHVETFVYLINATSDKKEVSDWIKKNEVKIKEFYTWNKSYKWSYVKADE